MFKKHALILILVLSILLLGVVLVTAEPSQLTAYTLQRHVLSSMSGQTLHSNEYQMVGTGGEPATGSMSGDGYTVTVGYIHSSPSVLDQSIYLPIVVR